MGGVGARVRACVRALAPPCRSRGHWRAVFRHSHNLCIDRHYHLAITCRSKNCRARTIDYSAFTSLRADLEQLLALMEAMIIRSSTVDGRCSIKLSLLCESTVPVGEAPV